MDKFLLVFLAPGVLLDVAIGAVCEMIGVFLLVDNEVDG